MIDILVKSNRISLQVIFVVLATEKANITCNMLIKVFAAFAQSFAAIDPTSAASDPTFAALDPTFAALDPSFAALD